MADVGFPRTPEGAAPREPQWLTLGKEAAGRALYEVWNPLRTDNGVPEGAFAWEDLDEEVRGRYVEAGEAACKAYHYSTLTSARNDIAAFFGRWPGG